MKIAVLTDSLVNRGGGEREIMTLLDYFDVDLYTGIYNSETTFSKFKQYQIVNFLKKKLPPFINTMYLRWKFKRIHFKRKYDAYVYFWPAPLAGAFRTSPNIWYCNTPLRYLYDCREEFLKSFNPLLRPLVKFAMFFIQRSDKKSIKNADIILANSINVRERVKKYYNLSSRVVYPPVNIGAFKFKEFGDFCLSPGRLEKSKGVHLAIKAFQKMPDKKLVVLGGGVEEGEIKAMCEGYSNIQFVGAVEEKKLQDYYANCCCTIYLSRNEDFGMIPIESMSAGKPCIAVNEGGFKETIIHKKNGYLVEPQDLNFEGISKGIEWTWKNAKKMKTDCRKRAKLFSEEKYVSEIREAIEEAIKK